MLKNIFTKAVEWNKISENKIKNVKLLRTSNKRLRYLEKEEIPKLINNCAIHLKPIVILALNTGMRRGEIFGLKWQDIDYRRGIIYLLDTKNSEKREVPINETVKRAILGVRKNKHSAHVFCNNNGKPYIDSRKAFHTALRKAEIKNFRFHDLRHTFASQLVMMGVDLNTVRELLGHKSLDMTLRYAHLSPDHKSRAVAKFGHQMDTYMDTKLKATLNNENIDSSNTFNYNELAVNWGHSSAGRTPRSQRGGRGFESP